MWKKDLRRVLCVNIAKTKQIYLNGMRDIKVLGVGNWWYKNKPKGSQIATGEDYNDKILKLEEKVAKIGGHYE